MCTIVRTDIQKFFLFDSCSFLSCMCGYVCSFTCIGVRIYVCVNACFYLCMFM